jgi:hypothetical protein
MVLFYPVWYANAQHRILKETEPFDEPYADSLLWERINDLRVKNKVNRLPHSFMVRKYISHKNALQLKAKNNCFHPDWNRKDAENRKGMEKMYQEFSKFFKIPGEIPKDLSLCFSYSEVAAASWGHHFETYNELAEQFAQMWWDSKGHKQVLYDAEYLPQDGYGFMVGVSIKHTDFDSFYGIANVIGFPINRR